MAQTSNRISTKGFELRNHPGKRNGAKEYKAVTLRYGIHDDKCKTLAHVGSILSLTRERIRQLESSGLDRLA